VEIITEFHIARDLKFAGFRLEPDATPSEDDERERRDAPDLVIIAGRELIVCEGKFFSVFNDNAVNNLRRLRIFGQQDKLRADRSKGRETWA